MKRSEKWVLCIAAAGLLLAGAFSTFYAASQSRLNTMRAGFHRPEILRTYEAIQAEAEASSAPRAHDADPAPEVRTIRDRIGTLDRLIRATAYTANDPKFAEALGAFGKPPAEQPADMLDTLRRLAVMTAPQLDELRALVAGDGPIFALDFEKGPAMELPHLAPMRNLARLLIADATVAQQDGDIERVVGDLDAVLGLADTLATEPILISQLVRIAIATMGCDAMRLLPQDGLSREQADLLIAHLSRADHRDGFAYAFAGEAAIVEVIFDEPDMMDQYEASDNPVQYAWDRIYRSPLGVPLRATDESAALGLLSQIQELGALPLFESRAQAESLEHQIEGLSSILHPYSRMLLPSLTRAGEAQARHEAMMDLAQLGLAVEQLHGATGTFPESLADVGSMLPDGTPVDPFTGEEYVYRAGEDEFVLYSVGPNLVDDGGRHHLREADIVWRGVVQPENGP